MRRAHLIAAALSCAAMLTACGSTDDTPSADPTTPAPTAPSCPTSGEEWEVAKLYVEHNATDEDTGLHGLIGGEPWRSVCVTAPDGTRLWAIEPSDRLRDLGVADYFWESNEPPNDEYSVADLRADFPEGDYLVGGTDVDGVERVATARFTHDIPAEPRITYPPLVPDAEEDEPPVVDGEGLVVTWEPVTRTIEGDPVTISGYQVIVTDEEAEDPDGWARPIYDVHVHGDVTELAVPDAFLLPDTLYELEVLAIEPSGNQTISVGFFRTT